MAIYWFVVASFLIITLYMSLGPWLYRRPWALLALGLITSAISVAMKATPIILKSFPQLADHAPDLELAASAVDPTLIGLSGGLIAAAFLLKLQISNALDIEASQQRLTDASSFLADVHRDEEDLKLVARSLSNEEFDARLKRLRANKANAIVDKLEAEWDVKDKRVPGL